MNLRTFTAIAVSTAILFSAPRVCVAAPTKEKQEELRGIWNTLVEAGKLYKQGQGEDAAKLVQKAQTQYGKFDAPVDRQTQALLDRIHSSLQNAHKAMDVDGIRLPPLERRVLESTPSKPDKPQPNTPQPDENAVSFARRVAPLLLQKCGRCHVSDSKGKFNMGTFAALMKGSQAGRVVFPGDADGSPLIELIVEGDMPRGGGKVSADELAVLKTWIARGAKDDGPSPLTPLARLTNGNIQPDGPPAAPRVETVKAGADGPSFGRDVAPVLAKTCIGCHGTDNPRANFSLANFQRLLRGGDSGAPIVPGKPAESLLIKKLKGQAGARMPLNLPPLSGDAIAAVEAWIAAGAKFDGPSPTAPVGRVASFVKAATSTHEELSAEREQIAAANWKLALPGIESHAVSSENFLLMGNVDEATLDELGKAAEEVAPQVASILGADAERPLIKGRLTLFVFPQRYDYSEFGQMVEKRKLPRQWQGHWNYDGIDAYGALVPSRSGKYSAAALIAQQLAGVYVAGRGAPRWFAEGAARVVAARIAKDDPRVQNWDEALPAALAAMRAVDDFLTGKLGEEEAMLAGYSFMKFLMKDARRFQQLLEQLEAGGEFEASFAKVYGGPPSAVAGAWARSLSAARRR